MILGLDLLIIIIIGLASFRLTRLIVFDKLMETLRTPFFDEVIEENDLGEKEIYLIPKKIWNSSLDWRVIIMLLVCRNMGKRLSHFHVLDLSNHWRSFDRYYGNSGNRFYYRNSNK